MKRVPNPHMFILRGHTRSHAPLFRCGVSSPPPSTLCCYNLPMAASCRIAIVGDVHDDWSLEEDTKALQLLKPDLVLFTGDFGNENVDLVGSISNLEFTKAIILGNHDAWNTQKFSASLGDEHVGYRRLDFPDLKLSAVGGRPFSCGGEHVYRKKFLTSSMFPKSTHGNLFNIPEILLPSTTRQSKIF